MLASITWSTGKRRRGANGVRWTALEPKNNPPAERPNSGRRLPRAVIALGVTSFFTDVGSEMIFPLLPLFITSLGGAPAFLGLVEGLADATSSLLKLGSGYVADRARAKKPLVVFGYVVATVVRPLVAVATAPWHVLAVRVTDRIGKGIRSAPRDVLIANSVARGVRSSFRLSSRDGSRGCGRRTTRRRGAPWARVEFANRLTAHRSRQTARAGRGVKGHHGRCVVKLAFERHVLTDHRLELGGGDRRAQRRPCRASACPGKPSPTRQHGDDDDERDHGDEKGGARHCSLSPAPLCLASWFVWCRLAAALL